MVYFSYPCTINIYKVTQLQYHCTVSEIYLYGLHGTSEGLWYSEAELQSSMLNGALHKSSTASNIVREALLTPKDQHAHESLYIQKCM